MADGFGPIGFQFIEQAPRDGTFVRLRFSHDELGEQTGQWQAHAEMKSGGAWFDRDGFYISPGPVFFAPLSPSPAGLAKEI